MGFDAEWIGYKTDNNYNEDNPDQKFGAPAAYLRGTIEIGSKVVRAKLLVTALGVYSAFINGIELDGFLEPGFTDYNKRLYFQTYDITDKLCNGMNVFGAILGDGWYTGNVAMVRRQRYGKYPLKLKMQLEVEYENGTTQVEKTSSKWLGTDGAIRENDILNGELKDLRLPHKEIFTNDYKGKLNKVETFEVNNFELLEAKCERVARVEKLYSTTLLEDSNKVQLDFKQNFAGVASFTFQGTRGQKIVIRHAEMLNSDGTLYTDNYRSAENKDVVILSGEEDFYTPTFTYHGFRYVEITSDLPFKLLSSYAESTHNNLKRCGEFECSDSLINQIYSNVLWGQRSNFLSIPTDCPQRDERLGWLADAHLFSETAIYNYDCKKFYEKFLYDISDSVTDEGVPDYAPYVNIFWRNNAGWADCAVILPYTHYKMYGDKNILVEFYSLMKKHIDVSIKTSENGIRKESIFNDWLSVDDDTPTDVFTTMYFYYSVKLFNEINEILGKREESYVEEQSVIYQAFNHAFVSEDGKIKGDTQTAYVMAYYFGLVDGEKIKPHLKRKLLEKNIHLSTGFNGCRYLLPTLSELGFDEYVYTLLLNKDYPSWGYSIENGATTIWERWNSYTKDKGFGDKGMNSFNHYSFGSCVGWLYSYMLGINPLNSGFKSIKIAPHFDPLMRVKSAKGHYDSEVGRISVDWHLQDQKIFVNVSCPKDVDVVFDFGNKTVINKTTENGVHKFCLANNNEKDFENTSVAT